MIVSSHVTGKWASTTRREALLGGFCLCCLPRAVNAASADPCGVEEVAEGIFVRRGADEGASQANADAIANIGFIVGRGGVLVTDPGGSFADGARLRAAIANTLEELLQNGSPILIDAASVPHRPDNLPPSAVWMPVPHQNIPRSVWLPGIGEGKLDASFEAYYQEQLTALTGKDRDRQNVFYCHPQCWASWNAAKRALAYGYRKIGWYRDGAEDWQDAGHRLAPAEPEGLREATR